MEELQPLSEVISWKCLHVLNQMTDTKMISFTLRRLQYSSVFLAAFPSLLRRYIKVCSKGKAIWDFLKIQWFLCSYCLFYGPLVVVDLLQSCTSNISSRNVTLLYFLYSCVCEIHILVRMIWGLIYSFVEDVVFKCLRNIEHAHEHVLIAVTACSFIAILFYLFIFHNVVNKK